MQVIFSSLRNARSLFQMFQSQETLILVERKVVARINYAGMNEFKVCGQPSQSWYLCSIHGFLELADDAREWAASVGVVPLMLPTSLTAPPSDVPKNSSVVPYNVGCSRLSDVTIDPNSFSQDNALRSSS